MANDCGLVRGARAGDGDAYAELVERYQSLAFRAAYLVTGNAQDAEDATQEGFMKAHAALDTFRLGEPFRPWLLRIVTNAACDRKRVSNRSSLLALKLNRMTPRGDAVPSPEGATVAAERRAALMKELDQMSDADRIVLTYRYFLDLPIAEMAAALEAPESTIRTRLLRARRRLRERLESTPQTFDSGLDRQREAPDVQ